MEDKQVMAWQYCLTVIHGLHWNLYMKWHCESFRCCLEIVAGPFDFIKTYVCIGIGNSRMWLGVVSGFVQFHFNLCMFWHCQGRLPRWLSWMRRPTGDQEVAGSTPAEVGNILSWRLIMKYFYGHSLPSADSRRAVVSFWRKNMHNTG